MLNKRFKLNMFTQCSTTPHNRETNKKLVKILHSLLEMDESAPFRKPVPHKALGLGDYKKIVKKPIDLNQIRRQNNDSKYKTIEQALDDIELCWQNCKLYNLASSEVYQQAINLQKIFWKMVNENFPEIYSATQLKIKEIESVQPVMKSKNSMKSQIYEGSQSQIAIKQEKQAMIDQSSLNKNPEVQLQQSKNSRIEDENNQSVGQDGNDNKSQVSDVKQLQKQPIDVSLKQSPSVDNIMKLTSHMKQIEDKSVLQQVLQILFTYEKQNLVASPKGQMHFRIQNIHLSTFYRICKVVKMDVDDMLEIIQ